MEDINLDNPIFTFYLNVEGMSQQRAAQHLAELKREVTYTNITSCLSRKKYV